MVNTLALESRGRGFKSRSRQFLVSLVFISFFLSLVSVHLCDNKDHFNKCVDLNSIKRCSFAFHGFYFINFF